MKKRFASHVFDLHKLQENVPASVFAQFKRSVDEKSELDPEVAEFVAREIKKWAESMGATHFVHWFLPLTGLTAGKENSFLEYDETGTVIAQFSGKDLVKGEPDASSFPHGGMRSTFEARGYTAWDPSSPVFVVREKRNRILYIPSVFFGYNGKVLDKKTPLLRSQRAINEIALKILHHFAIRVDFIRTMVGPEQEFFLVAEKDYRQRPDLNTVGRIILGSRPPRGQQMGDHYFGTIPPTVRRFLEDVEEEAFALGIPIKTRHNEVAPNQFEIAPLYEEANIASDHNQMLMELMRRIARQHGMVCLFHEKPFVFFNGSGKHLNWSLWDSAGRNLFSPDESKSAKLTFIAFLAGFLVGLSRHHDLLQSVLASPGNELRLGGHEAPPSIISVFLGDELEAILANLEAYVMRKNQKRSPLKHEVFLPSIPPDMSDRNRTSPVAFTGNKFEFRMPGSSASVAFPISVINLIVTDGLHHVYQEIAGLHDHRRTIQKLGEIISNHRAIVFNGDNYSKEWQQEAKKRQLYIPSSVPETIDRMCHKKNTELFSTHRILQPDEIDARVEIKKEIYMKTVEMELRVTRYMLRAYIIPAALKNQERLLSVVRDFPGSILQRQPSILDHQHKFIHKFTEKINRAMEMIQVLDEDNEKLKEGDLNEKAAFCSRSIRPHLAEAAALVEKIEDRVDRTGWPLPRIADILFR